MALYVLKTEDSALVRTWFEETQKRSKEENVLRNPITWNLKLFRHGKSLMLLCSAKPLYFNFSVFGWITGLGVFIIWGPIWVIWPCVVVGMMGFFWTAEFYAAMTKLALRRKAKYTGRIERIKLGKFIEEVMMVGAAGMSRISERTE
jgi:hypothetical protein